MKYLLLAFVFFMTLCSYGQDWTWLESLTHHELDGLEVIETPLELDSDADGNVYIGDLRATQVFKMSPDGEFLFSFGRKGRAPGEFTSVYDLAVDKKRKHIWVSDQIGWRIAKYDLEGTLLLHEKMAMQPYNIAVRSDGLLYVGGTGKTNLALYNPDDLKLVKRFGRPMKGSMNGATMKHLTGKRMVLTVDDKDRLYVAYMFELTFECYAPSGELLWESKRPWTNPDVSPKPLKSIAGGMSFEGQNYHLSLMHHQGVLYAMTSTSEKGFVAIDPKNGKYLGIKKSDLRLRGLSSNGKTIFGVNAMEATLSVSGNAKPLNIRKAAGFENRYRVAGIKIATNDSKDGKAQARGTASSGCSCGTAAEGECTAGCCGDKK